jgi:hypothetical protein
MEAALALIWLADGADKFEEICFELKLLARVE